MFFQVSKAATTTKADERDWDPQREGKNERNFCEGVGRSEYSCNPIVILYFPVPVCIGSNTKYVASLHFHLRITGWVACPIATNSTVIQTVAQFDDMKAFGLQRLSKLRWVMNSPGRCDGVYRRRRRRIHGPAGEPNLGCILDIGQTFASGVFRIYGWRASP